MSLTLPSRSSSLNFNVFEYTVCNILIQRLKRLHERITRDEIVIDGSDAIDDRL